MFKKLLIILIPLASLVLLTSSQLKINGIAGKTGSPGETNCQDCHSDFALNSGGGSITIQSPGTPGFQYTPNQLYTITVTVAKSGLGLFGVGVEALNSSNTNAGTFTNTNSSTHLLTAGNGRVNVVHSTNGGLSSNSMAFTFNWTAPAAGTGNVTFYMSGIAANNDNNESGDYAYATTQVFTEAACTNAPGQPVSISGTTSVCTGSTNTYSVAAVTGATSYVWTLPSGWTGTSTTNSISATSSSTSGNITVTANNACGASTPQTLAVTVNSAPNTPGTITGNTSPCSGISNTYSIVAVNGATAYTWTLPNGWTGTSTTNSINATSSSTSGNITVAANNSCGSSTPQSLAITANSAPLTPGAISGNATVCSGVSNTYNVAAVSGATSYTWTLPAGWTGSSTTNSISAMTTTTSGNITVKANNTCGSSSVQTLAVTANSIPAMPGAISGNTTICSGSSNTYSVAAVNGATGYTWTLPSGWTGSSTSNTMTVTAGSLGGNVTITANNACGSSQAQTLPLTIGAGSAPLQPGAISGIATICSGTSNTYSVASVSGATGYTWTLPTGWTGTSTTNSITALSGSTSGNVTVTANNTCGSSPVQTFAVTVNSVPATPGTISGSTSVCNGSSNNYSVSPVNGASSYTWTFPSGWTGSSTTNSITLTAGATGGNITVKANDSCGSSSPRTLAVTISGGTVLPQPGIISGNVSICSNSSNTYSVLPVTGATSYTWSLPHGWTGTSTTNSISTTADTTGGIITVWANNSCGPSAQQTITVTINHTPSMPNAILGNDTICSGSINTFYVDSVSGASTYTWSFPSAWSGTSTTDSIILTADSSSGNITVTASNNCGTSPAQALAVVIKKAPGAPTSILGDTTVCSGSASSYKTGIVAGATSYSWTLPGGWVGSSSTDSILINSIGVSGNISVMAVNSCGSSSAASLHVAVTPSPSPVVTFVNDTLFSSSPTNNQWNNNNNPIAGATDEFFVPLSNGIYSVTVTDSATNCSGTSSDYIVNTVGINNISGKYAVIIYPNPAQERLIIQIPDLLINAEVSLYNVYGQVVLKTILTQLENSIDISKLAEGSYSLSSRKGNNVTYSRLIILKN